MNIEHVCIYTSGDELNIKSLISACFSDDNKWRVIASSERRSLSGSYEDISAVWGGEEDTPGPGVRVRAPSSPDMVTLSHSGASQEPHTPG